MDQFELTDRTETGPPILNSNKPEIQIIASAYHEAGHAICALHTGTRIRKIGISIRNPGDGFTVRNSPNLYNPFYPGTSNESVQSAWGFALDNFKKEISIYLAGPLAEAQFLGGNPLSLRGADHDRAICEGFIPRMQGLYDYYCGYGQLPRFCGNQVLNNVRDSTKSWISRKIVWRTITAVAQVLCLRGQLDERQISYVVGQVKGASNQLSLDLM
jgi:hypothetical protein